MYRSGCATLLPRFKNAFTLLEVALVLIILGILSAIAVPRYGNFVAGQRADAAARRITTDLAFAQRHARVTSQSQTVSFYPTVDVYRFMGMPDPDNSGSDYAVQLAKEPYQASIVSADFGGDADLVFDGYGALDSGGTVVIRVGNYQRTITVDSSGTGIPEELVEKGAQQ